MSFSLNLVRSRRAKSSHPDTLAELLKVGTDILAFDFLIFQGHESLQNLGAH